MKQLSTIVLSSNQKKVLAKIIASATPKLAGEAINGDRNLVAAREQLAKLGAIEFVGSEASVTDIGERLAREENLIDEMGELTTDGQAFAQASSNTPAESGSAPEQDSQQDDTLMMSYSPKYEPMSLLKEMLRTKSRRKKFL